jgi:hypothetical protein
MRYGVALLLLFIFQENVFSQAVAHPRLHTQSYSYFDYTQGSVLPVETMTSEYNRKGELVYGKYCDSLGDCNYSVSEFHKGKQITRHYTRTVADSSLFLTEIIAYNRNGKMTGQTRIYASGDSTIRQFEYDSEGRIAEETIWSKTYAAVLVDDLSFISDYSIVISTWSIEVFNSYDEAGNLREKLTNERHNDSVYISSREVFEKNKTILYRTFTTKSRKIIYPRMVEDSVVKKQWAPEYYWIEHYTCYYPEVESGEFSSRLECHLKQSLKYSVNDSLLELNNWITNGAGKDYVFISYQYNRDKTGKKISEVRTIGGPYVDSIIYRDTLVISYHREGHAQGNNVNRKIYDRSGKLLLDEWTEGNDVESTSYQYDIYGTIEEARTYRNGTLLYKEIYRNTYFKNH